MLDRLLHTMPFVMLPRSMQRLDIRCPCGMPEVWDRDSVATAGTEYTIVCSAIALTTRGKKPLERSQHLITRLVRETEMGESLRDFGWRVSAVTAGGAMIGAENPETLNGSASALLESRYVAHACYSHTAARHKTRRSADFVFAETAGAKPTLFEHGLRQLENGNLLSETECHPLPCFLQNGKSLLDNP
jgi:hypothetical protein